MALAIYDQMGGGEFTGAGFMANNGPGESGDDANDNLTGVVANTDLYGAFRAKVQTTTS
jgi:hypothetical protein